MWPLFFLRFFYHFIFRVSFALPGSQCISFSGRSWAISFSLLLMAIILHWLVILGFRIILSFLILTMFIFGHFITRGIREHFFVAFPCRIRLVVLFVLHGLVSQNCRIASDWAIFCIPTLILENCRSTCWDRNLNLDKTMQWHCLFKKTSDWIPKSSRIDYKILRCLTFIWRQKNRNSERIGNFNFEQEKRYKTKTKTLIF